MRLRGRRIALLLAGALPLLADDKNLSGQSQQQQQQQHKSSIEELREAQSASSTSTAYEQSQQQQQQTIDEDENDYVPINSVEAIHYDEFRIPPLQPPPPLQSTTTDDVRKNEEEEKKEKEKDSSYSNISSSVLSDKDRIPNKEKDDWSGSIKQEDEESSSSSSSNIPGKVNAQEKDNNEDDDDDDITIGPPPSHVEEEKDSGKGEEEGKEEEGSSSETGKLYQVVEQLLERVGSASSSPSSLSSELPATTKTETEDSSNKEEEKEDTSFEMKSKLSLDEVPEEVLPSEGKDDSTTASSSEGGNPDDVDVDADVDVDVNPETNNIDIKDDEILAAKDGDDKEETNGNSNTEEIPEEEKVGVVDEHETDDNTHSTSTNSTTTTASGNSAEEATSTTKIAEGGETNTTKVDEQPADDDDENLTGRVAVDYASKSAGALILERSTTIKGTSNLLNGDKDRYAIAPCEDKKFVVIGLSEDILVKQIVLANYERFSSRVKDFQVMGSQTMGKFVDLGTYHAKAGNGEQTFDLMEPAWARYLKFKFLSHHGSEYYCTVSQIKVHGSTMLQGFHEQWEDSEEDGNDEEEGKGKEGGGEDDDESSSSSSTEAVDPSSVDEFSSEEAPYKTAGSRGGGVSGEDGEVVEAPSNTTSSVCVEGSAGVECTAVGAVSDSRHGIPPGLARFRETESLDGMLHGNLAVDDELFSTIFDLIPQSLISSRPLESIHSSGRKTNESDNKSNNDELRTTPLHQLTTSAIRSLYWSSQVATDAVAKVLLVEDITGTIGTPKMSDTVEDLVRRVKATVAGRGVDVQADALAQPKQDNKDGDSSQDSGAESDTDAVAVEDMEGTTELEEGPNSDKKRDEIKTDEALTETAVPTDEKTASKDGSEPMEDGRSSLTQEKTGEQEAEVILATSTRAIDQTLARMLERLPSADCLTGLDYAEFKARILASRKPLSGSSGATHGGGEKEPIFKKLTDEIKSLHVSLSVHDQFTKASVSCYQRVLLDLAADMEGMQSGQEARLLKLEEAMLRANTSGLSRFSSFILGWFSFCFSSTRWILSRLLVLPAVAFGAATSLFQHRMPLIVATQDSSRFTGAIKPWINRLQEVAVLAWGGGNGLDGSSDRSDQLKWVVPVFPAIALLILCRLMMWLSKAWSTRNAKEKHLKLGNLSTARSKKGGKLLAAATTEAAPGTSSNDEAPPIVDDELQSCAYINSAANVLATAKTKEPAGTSSKDDEVPRLVDDESQSCVSNLTAKSKQGARL